MATSKSHLIDLMWLEQNSQPFCINSIAISGAPNLGFSIPSQRLKLEVENN
jgi:hypothetical protein